MSRSGSRIISVSRLYDGTRRAKPIVSTSGSNAAADPAELARPAPRFSPGHRAAACGPRRPGARAGPVRAPQIGGRRPRRSPPRSRSASSVSSPELALGELEDLAGDPGGRVYAVGHRSRSAPRRRRTPATAWNMPRLTSPCSCETPLARCASRRPMSAMLKTLGSPPVLGAERQDRAPRPRPESSRRRRSSCSIRLLREPVDAGRDRSVRREDGPGPHGFQGLVVGQAQSTSSRIRSIPRKPAWPSLMWNTSGAGSPVSAVYARMARTPPMPSRSSCRSRCPVPPPYSRSVTCRSSGVGLDVAVEQQQRDTAHLRLHNWANSTRPSDSGPRCRPASRPRCGAG